MVFVQEYRERDCHDNAGQLLVEIIRVSRDSQITAAPTERFRNPLLETAESVHTVQVNGTIQHSVIPDPATNFQSSGFGSGSGSYPCYLSIFGNYCKKTLIIIKKKVSTGTNYLPFSISHYSPVVLHTYSPESSGLKLEINLYNVLAFFHFRGCWT